MKYAAFVINLDGSKARMGFMASALEAQKISYVRITAIDGRTTPATDFPQYDDARSKRYYGRALHGAEVACTLSHLRALERFLNSGADVGLILEDDVQLESDFKDIFEMTVQDLSNVEPNWGLLHLYPKKWRYQTPVAEVRSRQIYQLHEFPVGAGAIGYSRDGARLTLRGAERIYAPWDVYLKDVIARHDNGFGIFPNPVAVRGLDSDITPPSGSRGEITGAKGWVRKQRRVVAHEVWGARHWVRKAMQR